ncbi:hypothetical protein HYDPIDRAFT_167649 [Hydnomerulius pinastri MD-312]|uniref:Uncharacterized protein n=1 Tax=Hydnomerulius pinastri MD-312 TaxID=994086 RepID=A0A0C9W1R3_9AGAM|nr:hypothetical protein HYDPIDRAFT_167649 [Hydnomerulius pinastri MD-312]
MGLAHHRRNTVGHSAGTRNLQQGHSSIPGDWGKTWPNAMLALHSENEVSSISSSSTLFSWNHANNLKMSEYPEFNQTSPSRELRLDTSFLRPQSGGRDFLAEPLPRDRYSRHSSQTQPRVRDVTWISTSQPQIPSTHTHTPQTPRYAPPPVFQQVRAPTPVMRKSAPTITESELDAEYMTVSVDDREACNYEGHGHGFSDVAPVPIAANGKSEKKKLMGGFVSGLRRLPKVMSKSRLRDHLKSERQGSGGTAATFEAGRTALPRYQPPSSGVPETNSDDIPTVERVETPPRASSVSPPGRLANPLDGEASFESGRRARLLLSAVHEHSYEHSLRASLHAPRVRSRSNNTSISSRPFERDGEVPNAMSTPVLEPSIHSPILAEPRPSADFIKMESPIRRPPEESVASQLARVRRFFRDLNGLPWIASRDISTEYKPGRSTSRRRYSRQREPKQSSSWYTPRNNHPLDLLAGPSTTGLLPPQHSTPMHAHPQGAPPFILGSSANLLFAQPRHGGGGSTDSRSPSYEGPPSTDSHGSQPQMYAPAYVAQPLFVYPSGLPQPGGPPDSQFPRPVYMIASSSPQYLSQNDGGVGPRIFVPQPSGLRTPVLG